jgi:hypothetical protein
MHYKRLAGLQISDEDGQSLDHSLVNRQKGVKMTKILKTSASGRKCAYPGCENTLSIYNHEDYCHIHRDKMAQKKNKTKIPYHHVS